MSMWAYNDRAECKATRRRHCVSRAGVVLAAVGLATGAARNASAESRQADLEQVKTLERNGQYEQAIRRYRELFRQYPDSPEIRLGLATDLARSGQCEEVDSPRSRNPAASLARAGREAVAGICYFRRGDFAAARLHLERADGLGPGDKETIVFLARAYAASSEAGKGVRILKGFQSSHGDDPDVLYWIGTLYDQLAEQTYDAMARSYPDSYLVLETRGDQFLQQQKYDDALKSYEKALQAAPDAPGLHFDLGNTYWRMAKLDQAAAELATELKMNPNHARANYELGDIAVKQGNVQRGLPLLKKALALDPSLVEAHKSLGRAFLAQEEYALAADEFSIVAKEEPSDHTIHALLASVYHRMGRTQDAEEESRKYNQLMKQQMSDLQEARGQNGEAKSSAPAPDR
jgi:tetratricopeptide (TPR) repeat protein